MKAAKNTCLEDLLQVNWREEDIPKIELLLTRGAGASFRVQDNDGDTPLYCVSLAGGNKMAMLELLLAHGTQASIDMPDWWGTTPRFLAEIGGCGELKKPIFTLPKLIKIF